MHGVKRFENRMTSEPAGHVTIFEADSTRFRSFPRSAIDRSAVVRQDQAGSSGQTFNMKSGRIPSRIAPKACFAAAVSIGRTRLQNACYLSH